MKGACLFVALLAVIVTTACSSRLVERYSTDKKSTSVSAFEILGLSTPNAHSGGRTLLDEESDSTYVDGYGRRRRRRRGRREDDEEDRRRRGHRDEEERREHDEEDRRRRGHRDEEERREHDEEDRRRRGHRDSRRDDPPRRRRDRRDSGTDSASRSRMRGVLRVVVYGDGTSCFVKVMQRGMSYEEQFGDTTSTSAFIELFGHGTCEPGAKGVAIGFVRASVIAEATAMGDTCESKVIADVVTRTRDLNPDDGVDVIVGGAAGGEALAVCE